MKPTVTQHYLLTVRSDGRYGDQELSDLLAGRNWNLNGVVPHGVDSKFVARTPLEMTMIPGNAIKSGKVIISTNPMGGIQAIEWDEAAPPIEKGDLVYVVKAPKETT